MELWEIGIAVDPKQAEAGLETASRAMNKFEQQTARSSARAANSLASIEQMYRRLHSTLNLILPSLAAFFSVRGVTNWVSTVTEGLQKSAAEALKVGRALTESEQAAVAFGKVSSQIEEKWREFGEHLVRVILPSLARIGEAAKLQEFRNEGTGSNFVEGQAAGQVLEAIKNTLQARLDLIEVGTAVLGKMIEKADKLAAELRRIKDSMALRDEGYNVARWRQQPGVLGGPVPDPTGGGGMNSAGTPGMNTAAAAAAGATGIMAQLDGVVGILGQFIPALQGAVTALGAMTAALIAFVVTSATFQSFSDKLQVILRFLQTVLQPLQPVLDQLSLLLLGVSEIVVMFVKPMVDLWARYILPQLKVLTWVLGKILNVFGLKIDKHDLDMLNELQDRPAIKLRLDASEAMQTMQRAEDALLAAGDNKARRAARAAFLAAREAAILATDAATAQATPESIWGAQADAAWVHLLQGMLVTLKDFFGWFKNAWHKLGAWFGDLNHAFRNVLGHLRDAILNLPKSLAGALRGLFDKLLVPLQNISGKLGAIRIFIDSVNNAIWTVVGWLQAIWDFITSAGGLIPSGAQLPGSGGGARGMAFAPAGGGVVNNYYIDARGAASGVEASIEAALRRLERTKAIKHVTKSTLGGVRR